jgi:hypothetical protein
VFHGACILDRGRHLLGLLLVLPLGVVLVGGSTRSSDAPPRNEWTAEVAALTPGAPAGSTVEPSDVLAALTGGVGQPDAVGAGPHDEIEGEVTSELPAGYIPGTAPSSDLAAVLRQSQQRNGVALPAPTVQAAALALAQNPNVRYTRQSQITDLTSGGVDPRIVDFLTWVASARVITITSMRSDHSQYVAGTSRVSAHKLGRAVDIAAVNGQPCTGVPGTECGRLYEDIVNQLRGTQYQPSQVIHGYDPWPSETWNFAMGNHRDHIHVGY